MMTETFCRFINSVDIIIPVLNEEKFILKCLQSVLAFERPKGLLWRVYVVDGGSTDETLNFVRKVTEKHPEVELLKNHGRIQSCALNIALHRGVGEYVLRLDAHATYPNDYLMQCIQSALTSDADNVGGVFLTLPGAVTYQARVIQAVTTHRFGVGNAEFRLNPEPGPTDTVPYGFFKKSVFLRVGYYDERLVRGQDYELNRRILTSGGRIWLNPRIIVNYYNQPSIWGFLKKQFVKEGPYNAYLWYLAPYARAFRHTITGAFAAGVISGAIASLFNHTLCIAFVAIIGMYITMACVASIHQAKKYKSLRHAFTLPGVFFAFHFSHGIGVLSGLFRLALGNAPVQRIREPWPGYGRYRICPERVLQNTDAKGQS